MQMIPTRWAIPIKVIAFMPRINSRWDRLARWIAWKLPRRVVMWCGFRIGADATSGEWGAQSVPDLNFMDAMRRWRVDDE